MGLRRRNSQAASGTNHPNSLRRHVTWSRALAGAALVLGCHALTTSAGARLEARIVDDAAGEPLTARVVDHPDLKNRILPRELSVFAHTNPIYFLQDGRKVPEEASVAYLRKYVKGVLHWLGTGPSFANEQDRRGSLAVL
jgi:hypothetical protein